MITSENNQHIRRVRALMRSTRRRFKESTMVVEGLRVCRELMQSGCRTDIVLVSEGFTSIVSHKEMLAVWEQTTRVEIVSDALFKAAADTESPQGILAIAPIPELSCSDETPLVLIPDQVRDPGNLGTLLRTAWATGVGKILIPPGTVDFTNPKVVRAGMGAHFNVPIQQSSWKTIQADLHDIPAWVADAGGAMYYTDVNWLGSTVLIVGGEAEGASTHAFEWADAVRIPMKDGVESLNAAVAGSVLLFEAFRQRSRNS